MLTLWALRTGWALFASRTLRTLGANRSGHALQALHALWTSCTLRTLRSGDSFQKLRLELIQADDAALQTTVVLLNLG